MQVLDEHGNPYGGRQNAQSFDQMGKLLFYDEKYGMAIHAGNIFEGKTVKGATNLVVAMRAHGGYMYYMHGDKARKVKMEQFVRAVMSGDLEKKNIKEIDAERLAMAAIGLDAIANRRTAEETINYFGEGAEERFKRGE